MTINETDFDYPLTEGNLRDLLYLLDRLICRQEDRNDPRAEALADAYQLVKDIEREDV